MDKKRKKSSTKILNKYFSKKTVKKRIPLFKTPQISDSLKKFTGKTGVIPDLMSINNLRVSGPVVTAFTKEDDWGTSVQVIDRALPGEVIFIYAKGDDFAVWGELTSKAAKKKGINGTIIYGSCRDSEAIKTLDYPVFCKKIVPNAGWPTGKGKVNVTIDCQGTEVNPGDFLFADDSGVVVVPKKIFKEVIEGAKDIKNLEKKILKNLDEGKPLSKTLGI